MGLLQALLSTDNDTRSKAEVGKSVLNFVILACGCEIPSGNIFAVAFITRLNVQESYEALPVEQKVSFI